MKNFFDDITTETPPTAETTTEQPTAETPTPQPAPPKTDPKPATDSGDPFINYINQPTEHREEKAQPDDPENDTDRPEEEPVSMDAEGIEFASELAVNANTTIMGSLLAWMDGENPAEDFQPAPGGRELIKKAWARWFQILNINITANKGILYANAVAYAWHLMSAGWKFFGRLLTGKVRFPWSKKPQPQPEVEFHPGGPSPDFEAATKAATTTTKKAVDKVAKFVADNAENAEIVPQPKPQPEPPKKVCLESGQPFEPGTGFPRSKDHPLHDKFADRGSYQKRKERIRKEHGFPQANAEFTPEQRTEFDNLVNQV